jgi:transglutaminase-like putative cysteine protease
MQGPEKQRLFFEKVRNGKRAKAIALTVIGVLTFMGCGGKEGALSRTPDGVDYDSLPKKAPRPTKPADKLHAAASELGDLLEIQAERDLSGDQADKARDARMGVTAGLRAVHRQFAADRAKLTELDAKAALARLDKIETKAASLERSLQSALTQVPADGDRAAAQAAAAGKALRALSPAKPHQPLSSDLSFGVKNGKPRQPSLSAGVTPAYTSPGPTDIASNLPRDPEAADLAETTETKVTPAIHQLAVELDRDPVKIFEYVRNTIRYEPYYGIRKGADQTLDEKAGSDADQAALLVALLRDSGIHARFVQGTAELPADEAADWLAVDVAEGERLDAVPEILWAGGIPTSQVRSNGQLTKVRFGHVWAEAYVAGEAYRGVDEHQGGEAWLPLDPSIKQTRFNRPDEDIKQALLPEMTSWAEDFVAGSDVDEDGGVIAPPSAEVALKTKQTLEGVADDFERIAGEGGTLGDVIGTREIAAVEQPYLAATTPFRTLAVSGETRALPQSMHASVTFEVSGADPFSVPDFDLEGGPDGIRYTGQTAGLVNKRVTVAYAPATNEDEEIIDAYHGLLNGPAYASALVPVLRVDGKVVARGNRAVSTGYAQNFRITYRMPGFASDSVQNPVYVGSITSWALSVGQSSLGSLQERAGAWRDASRPVTDENVLTDGVVGESMSILAQSYFTRNDALNSALARAHGVHQQRSLSGSLVATDVTPTYIASFPVGTRLTGMFMDVDQDSQSVVPLEGDDAAISRYMQASGATASTTEGAVFEAAFDAPGISTMKIIDVATAQRIPLYEIKQDNAAALLPKLNISSEAREELEDAISQPGVTVIIPRDEVTIGSWTGTGYIVSRGDATSYRIMGGASGGILGDIENWLEINYWTRKLGAPDWLNTALTCVGIVADIWSLTIGLGAPVTGWIVFSSLLQASVAPLALTPAGWIFFAAIFCIIFFIQVFFATYGLLWTDDAEECDDDD